MAIYHLSAKIISRGLGQSVVASAAYRSAEHLHDERLDQAFDYSRKQGVEHSEILAPDEAPDWVRDRQGLWNAVERSEKRKDARLAREIELALPVELSTDQQIELVRDFANRTFVSQGMVVDFSIHTDNPENPHAHLLLTTREITADGFGPKRRDWNEKSALLKWRREWGEIANEHLQRAGLEIRIDHRTLQDQGIDLVPGRKIGLSLERQNSPELTERLAEKVLEQREIAAENGRRILEDPGIALTALTHHQATFTERDIAKYLHTRTDGAEQFQAAYLKVTTSPDLVALGRDDRGQVRYSTKEMLGLERGLLEQVEKLTQTPGHGVTRSHQDQVLTQGRLSAEQRSALEHVTGESDLALVVGVAGAGKSTMLAAAREVWEAEGYAVKGAALSGIAAENLEHASGISSRTLASWSLAWSGGRDRLSSRDVLVIDEAGLVGTRQLATFLDEAQQAGAKIVMLGDPEQLQAIEAGAAFRGIAAQVGVAELTEVRRQRTDWQREATRDLSKGRTQEALAAYDREGAIHAHPTREAAREAAIAAWRRSADERPADSNLILAYTRDDVRSLNEKARALREASGELGTSELIDTARGAREFAAGDRLYFLRNERSLGVKNGSLGTVEKIEHGVLQVRLDGQDGRRVAVDTGHYNHLDHGYAATVHKAQGATVDSTFVLASPHFDRHSTYVALSRHRESVSVFYGEEDFKPEWSRTTAQEKFKSVLSRARPKELALDYLERPSAPDRGLAGAHGTEPARRERHRFAGLNPGQGQEIHPTPVTSPALPERSVETAARQNERGLPSQRGEDLAKAIDAYARAWSDADRMLDRNLPILEHQKHALKAAGAQLDRIRPHAKRDLVSALQHDRDTSHAMTQKTGAERIEALRAGMEREEQVRTDPNLRARRVVLMWQQLEVKEKSIGFEHTEARDRLEQRFKAMTGELKRDPQIESILRERQRQLGIASGSRLNWVIHARTVEQALQMPSRGLSR